MAKYNFKPNFKKNVKAGKIIKEKRVFSSEDGTLVVLDKNRQICGGTFFSTHKGRPCRIVDNQVLCPVNIRVENTNDDGYHMEFDHYEVLIAKIKTA